MIAQQSLNKSTNILNQAIERMTTGAKLNHASDNAANYSISTNMTTQLNSYEVAQDNVAAGMDLVSVASDSLSLISSHASRIRDLCIQARNGTYGAQSIKAIKSEASARIAEIVRLYNTAEYNGINLLDKIKPENTSAGQGAGITEGEVVGLEHDITPKANGFIDDIVTVTPDVIVTDPTQLADAIANNNTIGIGNAETLAELAKIVNGTDGYTANNCSGKTITLTEDIDLSAYSSGEGWTSIGGRVTKVIKYSFAGTFDGQGHKIKNLHGRSLFGIALGELKNVGIENCNVVASSGSLAMTADGSVTNCYATGNVTIVSGNAGGLVAEANGAITNCYSAVNVTSPLGNVGGLVGQAYGTITNSYATGNVTGTNDVGGLVGYAEATITNSYATGDVTGNENVGGLAGYANSDIRNSYATGNVSGTGDENVGGLVGDVKTITNSYATGNVTGTGNYTGGLAGCAHSNITNSYATGNVTGTGNRTGGLGGYAYNVTNSYATGNVTGTGNYVGGLAGYANYNITNSYATGNVTGQGNYTGGLAGYADDPITNSYATGNVTGVDKVGGLAGYADSYIRNSYATGNVTGNDCVGGLAGKADAFTNCISYSESVTGTTNVGSFCGYSSITSHITNCKTIQIEGLNKLGSTDEDVECITYLPKTSTTLQVGINGDSSCQITFNTDFSFGLINSLKNLDVTNSSSLDFIDNFLNKVSEKQTELGAVQNRLDSAAESIEVSIENLTKSRSTLRDADIAKESSEYIKAQILQEASATLLSTANQSPAIALTLLTGIR